MATTHEDQRLSLERVSNIARQHELSRRSFMALVGSGGTAAVLAACQSGAPSASSPSSQLGSLKEAELISASATTLAKAIRTKQVSSEEVVKAYIQRIETVNPKLNAVVQLTAETALAQAHETDAALARGESKGPLHGVPFTVKDNIETAGVICTAGTKGRAAFVPIQDATIVARLRTAGAIFLGKTNMPELGLGVETDNLVYGRTNNPYDVARIAGGSSGGEAAIIAAGGSPFGLGNDSGGSIRSPAHFCGIVGLKPTSGRVPRTGHVPAFGGHLDALYTSGPLARFVEDLWLILPQIVGTDGHDPAIVPMPLGDPKAIDLKRLRAAFYIRLPLISNGIDHVVYPTPETVEAVSRAAKALADEGVSIEEQLLPGIEQSLELWARLVTADGGAGLKAFLQQLETTEVSPLMHAALESWTGVALSTQELLGWIYRWDLFRSAMLSFMNTYDVVLCPVNAAPAPPHGVSFQPAAFPGFVYPMAYNFTGWPAAVVCAGSSPEGLPIGIQIVSRPWREDIVLAVAQHIETALGGWQRPPL